MLFSMRGAVSTTFETCLNIQIVCLAFLLKEGTNMSVSPKFTVYAPSVDPKQGFVPIYPGNEGTVEYHFGDVLVVQFQPTGGHKTKPVYILPSVLIGGGV